MMIHIKVPATSANMGPGFDSIGVALTLYNHIWVEEIEEGLQIDIKRKQPIPIPTDESNLIYRTMCHFYHEKGIPVPGIHLVQEDFIPMVRGLGSSAACIVGGLVAANELAGRPCDKEELAQMAAKLEGHPDNSSPAIFGNMVVGAMDEKHLRHICMKLPEDLVFAIMVPDFPVSTEKSRAVLPDAYTRADVVYNVSRAALLVASVAEGNNENLAMAMEDKIHQPYRKTLIPHMDEIFAKAKEAGALACYLSGAGSTLMAMITDENAEVFQEQMSSYFKGIPNHWEITLLKPDNEGATAVKE